MHDKAVAWPLPRPLAHSVLLAVLLASACAVAGLFYHHTHRTDEVVGEPDFTLAKDLAYYVNVCKAGQPFYARGWMLFPDQARNTPIAVYVKNRRHAWVKVNSRVEERPMVNAKFSLSYPRPKVGFSALGNVVGEVGTPVTLLLIKTDVDGTNYGIRHVCS